jgi:uncharacterized protein
MSEQNESRMGQPGAICWNELMTTDVAGAKSFYTQLLGWKTEPFGPGMDYTILKNGDTGIGGILAAHKPGVPAHWLPYVLVEDVDATVAQTVKLGGTVCNAGINVPEVGRIAVLKDPQGAVFGIIKPQTGA